MATLKEYFDTDFSRDLTAHQPLHFDVRPNNGTPEEVDVVARVHFNFDANTKYLSCYIPLCDVTFQVCEAIIKDPSWVLSVSDGLLVESAFAWEKRRMVSSHLVFSGRLFIYHDASLSDEEATILIQVAEQKNLAVIFRDGSFAEQRSAIMKPVAFISHDWRDKDEIARPLAIELQKLMLPIWYDEFSLKVGDNLRESIERGLKECKKCVLIISPNFLSNKNWAKIEFNTAFMKQIVEQADIILPIWNQVSRNEVYEYSPTLANKVSVDWSLGLEEVSRQLYRAITANR